MAENLGAPSHTAANGKEQTWRLHFEMPDTGGVEITAHRRVVLRDASNDIVDRVDDPEMIEFLFPGSKFKRERPITLAEMEAETPGITASINSTIDAIIVDQKAAE